MMKYYIEVTMTPEYAPYNSSPFYKWSIKTNHNDGSVMEGREATPRDAWMRAREYYTDINGSINIGLKK